MSNQFVRYPKDANSSTTQLSFTLNGANQTVVEDTITPANNIPLPVTLIDTSGNLNRVSATQSGVWNITNITGTVSLPTGASTSAKQPALGTAGSASTDVITIQGIASMTPLSSSQSGNWSMRLQDGSGSGVNKGQTTSAGSLPVVLASDQSAVATKAPVNAAGSSPGSSTVSTAATLTAPANTVGFILMNLDTSTANIRWRIGATATNASGQQLQPGRDTGYVPCSANVSICSESGTQNYDVQWILSS